MARQSATNKRTPILTALPATALDGEEIRVLVDATNGIVWNFRYRAGSAAAQKWEFIGGQPLYAYASAPSAPTVLSSWTSPSDWPAIPLPVPGAFGDWMVEAGVRIANANVRSSPNFTVMLTGLGGAQCPGCATYNSIAGLETATVRGKTFPAVPPSSFPYRPGYAIFGGTPTLADVTYDSMWISVLPIRIGLTG